MRGLQNRWFNIGTKLRRGSQKLTRAQIFSMISAKRSPCLEERSTNGLLHYRSWFTHILASDDFKRSDIMATAQMVKRDEI